MAAKQEKEEDLKANKNSCKKQKAILLKALEQIPNDIDLWKEAISIEDNDGAKALLYRAVECIPHSTELWLALAKLETYEEAKAVLNNAISSIPTDHIIWMSAAKLEEAQGNSAKVFEVVKRAFKKLIKGGVLITRDQWLSESISSELCGSTHCSQAIIKEFMKYGLNDKLSHMTAGDQALKDTETVQIWIEEV